MTPFLTIIHFNYENNMYAAACNTYVRILRTRRTDDTKLVSCGNCKRTWTFKDRVVIDEQAAFTQEQWDNLT